LPERTGVLEWLFKVAKKPVPEPSVAGPVVVQRLEVALEHHRAGRLAQAEGAYREVLAADPENIDALHFLGVIAYQRGRHDQAEQLISRALLRNPSNAAACSNLGNALQAQGKHEQAVTCYRQALVLQPNYVDALVNLGTAFRAQGELDGAVTCYEKALQLKPDLPAAYNNLAIALIGLGRSAEAESNYVRALGLMPSSAELRVGFSLVKLLLGDYESGLALFESRLDTDTLPRAAYGALNERLAEVRGLPRWHGEPGAGRVLLVWTDQGFGDALMMMRFFPRLRDFGFSKVIVHCEEALVRVMQGAAGVDEVVSRERPSPAARADCHLPLMSLPFAFRTRVDTIPNQVPYLTVPVELGRKWAARVAAVKSPRVGLAWAGKSDHPNDPIRSVRLEEFSRMFALPGLSFFSLQKGEAEHQIDETGLALTNKMRECSDLLETAAFADQMDLVISVDTAIAHLAGALGKPVWLLNRFETEWRWMLDRDDSPWYPTMKIFRQRRPSDWSEPIARVCSALGLRFGIGQQ
jgi:Tfp pilus assembly protein PilF